MIFRQLFDRETSTYTYLLADALTQEAILIDPVKEQVDRDLRLLEELNLQLRYVLDTHVHADHITAAGLLRARKNCQTGIAKASGTNCADLQLSEPDMLVMGELSIKVLETPGHTNGCLSYWVGDKVFTGDALLIRGCGRTDFQNGSAEQLYDSVTQKLFTLPESTLVYPGHDYKGMTCSTIGEERNFNPRLSKSREEFIRFMSELKLDYPRKIMEAVPANLQCGLRGSSWGGNESHQDAALDI
jgi:glyoxylase-like metal-dependent hydrolase (beta-lactamase superfamily II)